MLLLRMSILLLLLSTLLLVLLLLSYYYHHSYSHSNFIKKIASSLLLPSLIFIFHDYLFIYLRFLISMFSNWISFLIYPNLFGIKNFALYLQVCILPPCNLVDSREINTSIRACICLRKKMPCI
jgi:hypothetical protein